MALRSVPSCEERSAFYRRYRRRYLAISATVSQNGSGATGATWARSAAETSPIPLRSGRPEYPELHYAGTAAAKEPALPQDL